MPNIKHKKMIACVASGVAIVLAGLFIFGGHGKHAETDAGQSEISTEENATDKTQADSQEPNNSSSSELNNSDTQEPDDANEAPASEETTSGGYSNYKDYYGE